MKKRLLAFCFAFALLVASTCFSDNAFAQENNEQYVFDRAESVCLYNVNSDAVIFSQYADKKLSVGCTAKIVTGLLACRTLSEKLDHEVEITENMLAPVGEASIKLKTGMRVTYKDLIYGLLCGGGNDAAYALAICCSGSIEAFVEQMNALVKGLHLSNTHFTNPSGRDDEASYTTVNDVLLLSKLAHANELYMAASSVPSYEYTDLNTNSKVKFFNRNALISTFFSADYRNKNAAGMISGNTDDSGYCLVTSAEKASNEYICIIMGADSTDEKIFSFEIANTLINNALEDLTYKKIAEHGKTVTNIDVRYTSPLENGASFTLPCVIMEDVYALTYIDADATNIEYRPYLHYQYLDAPVSIDTIVGGVDIIYKGEIIGHAVLVTDDSVRANPIILAFHNAKAFLLRPMFWVSISSFAIIYVLYYYVFFKSQRKHKIREINTYNKL